MSDRSKPAIALALGLVAAGCGTPSAVAPPQKTSPTTAKHDEATVPYHGPRRRIDLAGSWKYLPYDGAAAMADGAVDDGTWPSMQVPSSWFLLGRKEYPPKAIAQAPSFGDNAPGELWPADPERGLDYAGSVWFRRTFAWDGDARGPVLLDLDMVDYYAEVFLNGEPLARHEGYFQRWSVDVTRALRKGTNLLCVKVSAPALPFDMAQQYPVSFPKMQDQIKGVFGYHDTRPGATSYRGQERSTGGILRSIGLRETAGVELREITVTPVDVSARSARLVVEATVHNWTSETIATHVEGVVLPKNFEAPGSWPVKVSLRAAPGVTRARTEIVVENPALWWTWDYGRPNLYRLDADLRVGDETVDHRSEAFGVRSITRDDGWVFRLNGQRVYPRGTNYIATQWLSQADAAFYARDLRLMKDANLNAIRVHAHLERPELYDLADELGFLVWQDFPLQWGYTDLPSFHAEARKQAEDMIRRYGNHPSIVLWCMHNEAPHAMTWMQRKKQDQNLALDEDLAALAARLDPSRIVHRDSGTGDGHYYFGWYEGRAGDLATAKDVAPHVTEYGAAALPGMETLKTMFDERHLWPQSEQAWQVWQFADFQPKNTFTLAKVPRGRSVQELVANTQRYQASLLRHSTELLRRRKWAGSTGLYQFMFTDDWPAITWAVVDYYRRPKQSYESLQSAMQPVLPSIAYDVHDPGSPLSLHVVNDHLDGYPRARVAWQVVDKGGKLLTTGERQIDVPADSVMAVAQLGVVRPVVEGTGRLEVWIEDAQHRVLGRSRLGLEDFIVERR